MGCCGSSDSSPSSEEPPTVLPSSAVDLKDDKTEPNAANKNNKSSNNETTPNATKQDGKESDNSRSSAELSWNLDGDVPDNRKVEFKLRISQRQSEIEEQKQQLADMKSKMFNTQVSKKKMLGLYDLFKQHANCNDAQTKMDVDGLTTALKEFGMIIDTERTLQKFVWSKFDIDNEGEIDYNDFMATLSSLIGSKDEDSLLLMFQIFDIDQDGYLNTDDMAMIILAQNQIALAVTGHVEEANENDKVVLNKRICLKLARKIITKYDSDQFKDSKISFDEYQEMMKNTNVDEMMLTNRSGLPSMDSVA
eukprot:46683_1